jgi:hypothetical protein
VLHPKIQVTHGDGIFVVVVRAIKTFVVEAGKMQDRLAHGLAEWFQY